MSITLRILLNVSSHINLSKNHVHSNMVTTFICKILDHNTFNPFTKLVLINHFGHVVLF